MSKKDLAKEFPVTRMDSLFVLNLCIASRGKGARGCLTGGMCMSLCENSSGMFIRGGQAFESAGGEATSKSPNRTLEISNTTPKPYTLNPKPYIMGLRGVGPRAEIGALGTAGVKIPRCFNKYL